MEWACDQLLSREHMGRIHVIPSSFVLYFLYWVFSLQDSGEICDSNRPRSGRSYQLLIEWIEAMHEKQDGKVKHDGSEMKELLVTRS
jgi:hypothetical protein